METLAGLEGASQGQGCDCTKSRLRGEVHALLEAPHALGTVYTGFTSTTGSPRAQPPAHSAIKFLCLVCLSAAVQKRVAPARFPCPTVAEQQAHDGLTGPPASMPAPSHRGPACRDTQRLHPQTGPGVELFTPGRLLRQSCQWNTSSTPQSPAPALDGSSKYSPYKGSSTSLLVALGMLIVICSASGTPYSPHSQHALNPNNCSPNQARTWQAPCSAWDASCTRGASGSPHSCTRPAPPGPACCPSGRHR